MADQSIIKEFLVALGYKNDEAGLKKFENGIWQATKAVVGLVTAIEASAAAVAIGVTRFADNLEQLYFASQRTTTSVANIKAFELAVRNFGGTAEGAENSLESLARFLRNNPGGEAQIDQWLRQVGHSVREAHGDMALLAKFMGELFAMQKRTGQQYLSPQLAEMWGLDEKTMLAIRDGKFAEELSRIRREMSATDWQRAAKDSHEFMMQLRDLMIVLEGFAARVEDALLRKLGLSLKTIRDWLNDPGNADKVANVVLQVVHAAEWLGEKIGWLIGKFKEWDTETNGWSTKIALLIAGMKLLGGFEVLSAIASLAGALGPIGITIAAIVAGLYAIQKYNAGRPPSPYALDAVSQLQNMGVSRNRAIGIVANLSKESNLDPNSDVIDTDNQRHRGIASWNPTRWAALEKWAADHQLEPEQTDTQLKYIAASLRGDPGTEAEGASHAAELLNRPSNDNPGAAAEIFSRFDLRPAGGEKEAVTRGNAAMHLAQQVTIYVDGAKDPSATADEINAKLKSEQQQATRDYGAVLY